MRKLRQFYPPDKIEHIYGGIYDPNRWPEHKARIARTVEITNDLIAANNIQSVADYSAGDHSVADGLRFIHSFDLADIGSGDAPIEQLVQTMPFTDLYVCTETIEHLEAPWTVLEYIALRTKYLVLSTPLDEAPAIGNYEHYWSFTEEDVATILWQSGFRDCQMIILSEVGWTYTYQLWTARSDWNTDRIRTGVC